MTLTRDLLVYIKIYLLIVLVGVFYWRDFSGFWHTAISTGWMVFALVVLFLFLIFLFQRRNALKTLFSISEKHNSQGAGSMLLALVLYVVGSYTQYGLWLHLCSLIFFLAGYLALIIDFRIPRMLFLPLVALLFVVPPFGIEVFEVHNLSALFVIYLSADALFVALMVYIASSSKRWRTKATGFSKQTLSHNEMKDVDCPLCQSDSLKEELFCVHCGRQRLPVKLKPFKFAFKKFLVLLSIVLVLSSVYLPTFSLVDRSASIMSYTPHGTEEQTIIPTPDGWKLQSSERLVDYEREHLEDFVVVSTYVWGEFSQNKAYIQLEIGSGTLYMRNEWLLPDWQRSSQDISPMKRVIGHYVVLQKENDSITVLYWRTRLLFRVGSVVSTKNVGVSVFSNFTEPVTESKAVEVLAEFSRVSKSIINWWVFISRWMLHFETLSKMYIWFGDVFFTAVGVVVILMFSGWARAKDEKVDRLAEKVLLLIEDEAMLLVAISGMKRRRFLGKELFDAYRKIAKSEVDLKGFYERLKKLSMSGLITEDYVPKSGGLVMVWKRMFP